MSRQKSDWADLYPDILISISTRLETRPDYTTIRSICHKWHSSIPKIPPHSTPLPILSPPNFPHPLHPTPPPLSRNYIDENTPLLLVANSTFLLRPKSSPNTYPKPPKPWLVTVEEFNHGKLFLRVPLINSVVRDYPANFPKCFDTSNIDVVEIRRDFNLRYEDEFTEVEHGRSWRHDKVIFFDGYAIILHGSGELIYMELNDPENYECLSHSRVWCFDDVVNYKGNVWAIDRKGRVYNIVVEKRKGKGKMLKLSLFSKEGVCTGYVGDRRKRLVESEDGLYLIDRYSDDELVRFNVYKLNEEERKWDEVKDIGGRNLFVCTGCCFFVDAEEFPGCRGNCVFFPKDHFPTYSGSNHPDYFYFKGAKKELEVGVCHLDGGETGLVTNFRGYSEFFWPPPKWLSSEWDGEEEEDAPEDITSSLYGTGALDFSEMNVLESDECIATTLELQAVDVPWSDIPLNLLSEIAKFLNNRVHLCGFRAVCKKWRASCPPPPIPNLLCSHWPRQISTTIVPFAGRGLFNNVDDKLSLVTSTVFLLRLRAQSVMPPKSWIVTVEEANPGKLFLRLPLRHALLKELPEHFPKAFTLSDLYVTELGKDYTFRCTKNKWDMFWEHNTSFRGCQRVVLFPSNVSPSPAIEDTTALVLYDGGNLCWFRVPYEYWVSVRSGAVTKFDDIVNFKGQAYTVDRKGRAYIIRSNEPKASRVTNEVMGTGSGPDRQKRLVVCDEQLFLVLRYSPEDHIYFRVYRLDEGQLKWDELTSLGDKILFVTPSICFFASAREFPGWKSNCIVFPADCLPTYSGCTHPDYRFFKRIPKEQQIGVYYLGVEDGAKVINSYPGYLDLFWPPPAWLQPLAVEPMVVNSSVISQGELPVEKFKASDLKSVMTHAFEDSEVASSTENFRGVKVRSELFPVLQKIWAKYGDIAEGSTLCNPKVLETLAWLVLNLISTPGKSLEELRSNEMKVALELLQASHLKVDWLVPFVDKADACCKAQVYVKTMRETEKMKAKVQEFRQEGVEPQQLVELDRNADKLKSLVIEKLDALVPVDLEKFVGHDLF